MKTTVMTIEIVYQDLGDEPQGPEQDNYTGYYYTLNGDDRLLGVPCNNSFNTIINLARLLKGDI